jgi:hypothetical protein
MNVNVFHYLFQSATAFLQPFHEIFLSFVTGLRQEKLSKIYLNLVTGDVFDLQNEFHDNGTRFGGFRKKKLTALYWPFLGWYIFGPQIFCQEVSVLSGNLLGTLIRRGIRKKWYRDDLLTPQIPT